MPVIWQQDLELLQLHKYILPLYMCNCNNFKVSHMPALLQV